MINRGGSLAGLWEGNLAWNNGGGREVCPPPIKKGNATQKKFYSNNTYKRRWNKFSISLWKLGRA
jgi:hypothetical protein